MVATGDILSGTIKVGDTIKVDIAGQKYSLPITGVEMGDRISAKEYFVGLVLKSNSDINLTGIKLKPQTVEIFAQNDRC